MTHKVNKHEAYAFHYHFYVDEATAFRAVIHQNSERCRKLLFHPETSICIASKWVLVSSIVRVSCENKSVQNLNSWRNNDPMTDLISWSAPAVAPLGLGEWVDGKNHRLYTLKRRGSHCTWSYGLFIRLSMRVTRYCTRCLNGRNTVNSYDAPGKNILYASTDRKNVHGKTL